MASDALLPIGGWWHQPDILASTGDGVDIEEKRGYDGFWNEDLIGRLETEHPNTLKVVLTGRTGPLFLPLFKRILGSRRIKAHLLMLKPADGRLRPMAKAFPMNDGYIQNETLMTNSGQPSNEIVPFTTLNFKFRALEDLIAYFYNARKLTIWEDRPAHATSFREFSNKYLESGRLQSAAVIDVRMLEESLRPSLELDLVFEIVNRHNAEIGKQTQSGESPLELKRRVQYTAYFLSQDMTNHLINQFGPTDEPSLWKISADHCTIVPHHCPVDIMKIVGGLGSYVPLRATAVAKTEDCIAIKVEQYEDDGIAKRHLASPIYKPQDERIVSIGSSRHHKRGIFHTRNIIPHITIAHCPTRGGKPHNANLIPESKWLPLEPPLQLGNAICGEKYIYGAAFEERFARVPPMPAAISIGKLVTGIHSNLHGAAIGSACSWVEYQMQLRGIVNAKGNENAVEELVRRYDPSRQRKRPHTTTQVRPSRGGHTNAYNRE